MQKRRIGLIIIVSILVLSSFFIGKTFSKYITTIEGNGIGKIAKWSFKANGETSTLQKISLVDTTDQSKLVKEKIAPGTSGQFEIIVDATGCEVGLEYKVEFQNETNKPNNLRFQVGDTKVNSIKELESVLAGTINANDDKRTRNIIVEWYWPYTTGENANQIIQNDLIDTQNATNLAEYTFDISITGTQLVPKV